MTPIKKAIRTIALLTQRLNNINFKSETEIWDNPFFSRIDRIALPRLIKTGLPACDGDGFAIPQILIT